MNFLLGVVGRYGVGKSTLCQSFEQKGIGQIKFKEVISRIDSSDQVPDDYTRGRVDELSSPLILDKIKSELLKEKGVIEIPSYVDVEYLCRGGGVFKYIVSVDCPESAQKNNLELQGYHEDMQDILLQSGYDRKYYTSLASDVFLNTVSPEHIDWVAHKLLLSYQLEDHQELL